MSSDDCKHITVLNCIANMFIHLFKTKELKPPTVAVRLYKKLLHYQI